MKGIFKSALKRNKRKQEKIQGKMSALSVAQQVLDDKDTIRQTMSKVPEYRQVDDLEKTVTYLTNLGFWKKLLCPSFNLASVIGKSKWPNPEISLSTNSPKTMGPQDDQKIVKDMQPLMTI